MFEAAGAHLWAQRTRAAVHEPETVAANLASVYRKLGIRPRAELGARLAAA